MLKKTTIAVLDIEGIGISNDDYVNVSFNQINYIAVGNTCFILRFDKDLNKFKKINFGKIIKIDKNISTVKLKSNEKVLPQDRCVVY